MFELSSELLLKGCFRSQIFMERILEMFFFLLNKLIDDWMNGTNRIFHEFL